MKKIIKEAKCDYDRAKARTYFFRAKARLFLLACQVEAFRHVGMCHFYIVQDWIYKKAAGQVLPLSADYVLRSQDFSFLCHLIDIHNQALLQYEIAVDRQQAAQVRLRQLKVLKASQMTWR